MNITLLTTMTWIERRKGLTVGERVGLPEAFRKGDQTSGTMP